MSKPDRTDQSAGEKLLAIINALDELKGAGVTDIAKQTEIPKSTVHYHLDTLCNQGFVVKDRDLYRIGLRFLEIGEHARHQIPLYEAASPEMPKLAQSAGELALMMVEEQGVGVYLDKVGGEDAIDVDAPIGRHAHLHNRALGKAILAHLDEDQVNNIVQTWGLPATTKHTITEEDALFEELKQIRNEGVAFNREESIEGMHGVGVPILNGDQVMGAISIAGPSTRMSGEQFTEKLPSLLSQSKNVIQLKLQKI